MEGGFMANTQRNLLMALARLLVTAAMLTGCSSQQLKRTDEGNLYIVILPSSQVRFSDVNVRQKGDELVISGNVSRRNVIFSGSGQVDIAVVSGERIIDQGSVSYTPSILPKTPGARSHHSSSFEARFRCHPPQWSIIRIAYHPKTISEGDIQEKENFALPENYDYGG
jgi:hypothetical protein